MKIKLVTIDIAAADGLRWYFHFSHLTTNVDDGGKLYFVADFYSLKMIATFMFDDGKTRVTKNNMHKIFIASFAKFEYVSGRLACGNLIRNYSWYSQYFKILRADEFITIFCILTSKTFFSIKIENLAHSVNRRCTIRDIFRMKSERH